MYSRALSAILLSFAVLVFHNHGLNEIPFSLTLDVKLSALLCDAVTERGYEPYSWARMHVAFWCLYGM